MDCSNLECGQAIEQGNNFCTKCGAPGRKEDAPPKTDIFRKTRGRSRLFFVTLSAIMVMVGIIYVARTLNNRMVTIKEVSPNTSTTTLGNKTQTKPGGAYDPKIDNYEGLATRVCSEYIRVWKECYFKASEGILPALAIKDIASEVLIPSEIEWGCREGFIEHGRLGNISSPEINKKTSEFYSECFSSYISIRDGKYREGK